MEETIMPDGLYPFVQLPPQTEEILEQILVELRGIRLAIVHMATQDRSAVPDDFDVLSVFNEQEFTQNIS